MGNKAHPYKLGVGPPTLVRTPLPAGEGLGERPLHQRAEMVEVSGSCDSAAEEGDALANMSVCATHDGDGRPDGGENRHDELYDVLNGFFLHFLLIVFLFLITEILGKSRKTRKSRVRDFIFVYV